MFPDGAAHDGEKVGCGSGRWMGKSSLIGMFCISTWFTSYALFKQLEDILFVHTSVGDVFQT